MDCIEETKRSSSGLAGLKNLKGSFVFYAGTTEQKNCCGDRKQPWKNPEKGMEHWSGHT
jgi:hypothetical protein